MVVDQEAQLAERIAPSPHPSEIPLSKLLYCSVDVGRGAVLHLKFIFVNIRAILHRYHLFHRIRVYSEEKVLYAFVFIYLIATHHTLGLYNQKFSIYSNSICSPFKKDKTESYVIFFLYANKFKKVRWKRKLVD